MTDLEINKALTLAIGWPEHLIHTGRGFMPGEKVWVCIDSATKKTLSAWQAIDYRDPAVIWPIAERFDCFPWKSIKDDKEVWCAEGQFARFYESCSKKAVAMAVIGAKA